VIKRRIERAQELMMQEQSIANIAFKVGFVSQSQFGRHFKRLTRVTPKQFLKSSKNLLKPQKRPYGSQQTLYRWLLICFV